MPVQLLITMSDDGQVTVQGPIENLLLTFGLLELAKAVVLRNAAKEPSRIVPAAVVLGRG